jgi:hypothetical protein
VLVVTQHNFGCGRIREKTHGSMQAASTRDARLRCDRAADTTGEKEACRGLSTFRLRSPGTTACSGGAITTGLCASRNR